MAELVRAGGGVVWRMSPDRSAVVEVLLVHRPRHDDWSFPKGKVEAGDVDDEATARREVLEETGYECALGRELTSTAYIDSRGRPKRVRYWEMRVIDGAFLPNAEVDEVVWLPIGPAGERLSYPHDRIVLEDFADFAAGAA